MSEVGDIIEAQIERLDALRETFCPPDSWAALLKTDGDTQEFVELRRFTSGFCPQTKHDGTRNRPTLEIATTEDLSADIRICSHFAFNGQCYETSDGDVTPPFGSRVTWLIFGTIVPQKFDLNQ